MTLRCRPRERGDPVNADSADGSSVRNKCLEYWVPAFAGTTAAWFVSRGYLRSMVRAPVVEDASVRRIEGT